jgi:hypothetical protein
MIDYRAHKAWHARTHAQKLPSVPAPEQCIIHSESLIVSLSLYMPRSLSESHESHECAAILICSHSHVQPFCAF